MKCPYCAQEIPDGSRFCPECGRSLAEQPAAATAPPREEPQASYQQTSYQQQASYQQAPYQQPAPQPAPAPWTPALKLPTDRGLAKFFFLSLITLGIYGIVVLSRVSTEINITASRYDGKRTMHLFAMAMLAPVTLGIYAWVWEHQFSQRVGDEARRRGMATTFGAKTFWLWGVLGSLIIVGPFVYTHKLFKTFNYINDSYNRIG
ncbi:MAG: DUF4234 domain-containing protein [Clostridia bacterium]|nr:DUF4234 domain-containing protein [Clostridia bacterium]